MTSNEFHTIRGLKNFITGEKSNSGQNNTSHSQRDSISSTKSANSDEDPTKNKIILDETLNPKRPLRPNRLNHQNSTSSPSNSNQGSRPISHLSSDDPISSSMQIINNSIISGVLGTSFDMTQDDELSFNDPIKKHPPPKPPKPTKIYLRMGSNTNNSSLSSPSSNKFSNGQNNNSSHSSENLIVSEQNSFDNSTASLNNLQFKTLTSKTTSDSVLNRVSYFIFN